MPRATKGAARRQAKKRWFQKAKGNRGARRTQWRKVKEAVIRAGVYQYEHRRLVKRDYRRLWITRISAACRMRNTRYSRFINGLQRSACVRVASFNLLSGRDGVPGSTWIRNA